MLCMILYCIILYDNKWCAKTPPEVETRRGPISIEVSSDSSPWRESGGSISRAGLLRISGSSASLAETPVIKTYCLLSIYYELNPGSSVVKNLPANAGDVGSITGSGSSPADSCHRSLARHQFRRSSQFRDCPKRNSSREHTIYYHII